MSEVQVWLLRHAESEVNALQRSDLYTGACLWSELTLRGREAALRLGESWRGKHIDLWLTSPAIRAQQTCRHIQYGMDLSWPVYELVDGIVELKQGEAEGKSKKLFPYRVRDRGAPKPLLRKPNSDNEYREAFPHCSATDERAKGAESQEEVFARSDTAIRISISKFLETRRSNDLGSSTPTIVVACTHETVIRCLLCGLRKSWSEFTKLRVGNLEHKVLEFRTASIADPDSGDFREALVFVSIHS